MDEGAVTVGTHVNISHLAATPLGQQAHARTKLSEIKERRLIFNVVAYDERLAMASMNE